MCIYADVIQTIDFTSCPVQVEAGHFLAVVCAGGDTGISSYETAGGAFAYTMPRAPDFFNEVGENLQLDRDTKVRAPVLLSGCLDTHDLVRAGEILRHDVHVAPRHAGGSR